MHLRVESNQYFFFRFLVVCTYQPDTLTVRASFSVPGKGDVAPVQQPQWETDRAARDRKFRMVDKSALVLKQETKSTESNIDSEAVDAKNAIANVKEVISSTLRVAKANDADNEIERDVNPIRVSKYARLVNHISDTRSLSFLILILFSYIFMNLIFFLGINSNYTGMVIVASLSVILIGALVYILHREKNKRRRIES